MKLAIVSTHPIQYYTPWFKYISTFIELHVFYMHNESASERAAGDFGVTDEWDIDLLSGYKYKFLTNIAKEPSVNRFYGCDTPEISEIVKEENFDAVLVLGWYVKSFWQTIFACKRYNIPVFVRGDSQLQVNQSRSKKIIKHILYPLMLRIFDAFLYVGKKNKEYLKFYNVPENKMFFCPHFIDQEFFYDKSQKSDSVQLRKEMGIEKNAYILLFVGKFIEKKRPLDILKAMKLLYKEKVNIELIFVGSGKLEKELIQYCEQNNELKVHFVGFKNQTELPAYFALADLLVLPSESGETWGLVVNEAFATLTPAIVSDQVGCMPDLIDSNLTGDIFKCGDISDLSNKIKNFVYDSDIIVIKKNITEKNKIYSIKTATKNLINAMGEFKK